MLQGRQQRAQRRPTGRHRSAREEEAACTPARNATTATAADSASDEDEEDEGEDDKREEGEGRGDASVGAHGRSRRRCTDSVFAATRSGHGDGPCTEEAAASVTLGLTGVAVVGVVVATLIAAPVPECFC